MAKLSDIYTKGTLSTAAITGDYTDLDGLQTALDNKEPADPTILKEADIGVTVQGYNPNTVTDDDYPTVKSTALSAVQPNTLGTAATTAATDYATAAQGALADTALQDQLESVVLIIADGDVAVETDVVSIESFPYALTIQEVILTVKTAPTGSNIIAELLVNDVSIMSTAISIDANETTSETAAIPYVLTTTSIAKGARVSVNVVQVGATVPGINPQLIINGERV